MKKWNNTKKISVLKNSYMKKINLILLALVLFLPIAALKSNFLLPNIEPNQKISVAQTNENKFYLDTKSVSTESIDVDVDPNNAIILTDKESDSQIHIKNYKKLINVSVVCDKPDTLQVVDMKDGSIKLRALKIGSSTITINAINAQYPINFKVTNGYFKPDDILKSYSNLLVTTRGLFVIQQGKIKQVFKDTVPSLTSDDVIAATKNILVTTKGTFNVHSPDNISLIDVKLPANPSKEDIWMINASSILTAGGFYSYTGKQIETSAAIDSKDKLIYSSLNVAIFQSLSSAPDGKKDTVYYCSMSHEPKKLTNIPDVNKDDFIMTSSFTDEYNEVAILTKDGLYRMDNDSKIDKFSKMMGDTTIDNNSIFGMTEGIVLTSKGIFSLRKNEQMWTSKYTTLSKDDIWYLGGNAVVTKKGILSSNDQTLGDSYYSYDKGEFTKDDIVAMTQWVVFTKKAALGCGSSRPTYSLDLTKEDLISTSDFYLSTNDGNGYLFVTKTGVYKFTDSDCKEIKGINNFKKNEIMATGDSYILFPGNTYWINGNTGYINLSFNDIKTNFPKPMDVDVNPSDSTSYMTSWIIGGVFSSIIVIIASIVFISMFVHKHNKKTNKKIDVLAKGIVSVFKSLDSSINKLNRPKQLESKSNPKNINYQKVQQVKKPFKPINSSQNFVRTNNNVKPPIFKSVKIPKK